LMHRVMRGWKRIVWVSVVSIIVGDKVCSDFGVFLGGRSRTLRRPRPGGMIGFCVGFP